MIVLLFTFWGTSILFTIVVIPVYIPTDSVQESKISTALPILAVIFWVFKNTIAIPTCVRWYHIVILICISLINSEVEHFSHTGGHLYVLLREMSVQVLGWILKSGLFLWLVLFLLVQFSSVAQLCPTLQPHGLQHARLPCPSPTPGVYSNSCPSSRWCHPAISSSVGPLSSHFPTFPASGSFPMSQFFISGGQSIGVSASASVLPMNIQEWFPLGWTGWISLQSKGLSRVFSNTTVQKHQYFGSQLYL